MGRNQDIGAKRYGSETPIQRPEPEILADFAP
jgi:hypothetical protein